MQQDKSREKDKKNYESVSLNMLRKHIVSESYMYQ